MMQLSGCLHILLTLKVRTEKVVPLPLHRPTPVPCATPLLYFRRVLTSTEEYKLDSSEKLVALAAGMRL